MNSNEQLIAFIDVPKHVPGRPHISQVYRWAMRGLRGVRMEFIQIGGKRYTSVEALERFYAAVTARAKGETPMPAPTSATQRRMEQAAEQELRDAGFEVDAVKPQLATV